MPDIPALAERRLQHIETSISRLFEQDIAISRINTDTAMALASIEAKLDRILCWIDGEENS